MTKCHPFLPITKKAHHFETVLNLSVFVPKLLMTAKKKLTSRFRIVSKFPIFVPKH